MINEANRELFYDAGMEWADNGERVLFSDYAAELYKGWREVLIQKFGKLSSKEVTTPPLISENVLEKAGYIENFSKQLVDKGNGKYGTPASCFHFFNFLEGSELVESKSALVAGSCFRQEDGKWLPPYRLREFHMLEFVSAGREGAILEIKSQSAKIINNYFKQVGLGGIWKSASDSFFLGERSGAMIVQKLKNLKQEYVVSLEGKDVALTSINGHEDYFGRRFNIKVGGNPIHSFCIAFGLERLVAASLLVWGKNPSDWPDCFNYE